MLLRAREDLSKLKILVELDREKDAEVKDIELAPLSTPVRLFATRALAETHIVLTPRENPILLFALITASGETSKLMLRDPVDGKLQRAILVRASEENA